ncbi:MAG: VCBS repeat-containing protein [bacterium]
MHDSEGQQEQGADAAAIPPPPPRPEDLPRSRPLWQNLLLIVALLIVGRYLYGFARDAVQEFLRYGGRKPQLLSGTQLDWRRLPVNANYYGRDRVLLRSSDGNADGIDELAMLKLDLVRGMDDDSSVLVYLDPQGRRLAGEGAMQGISNFSEDVQLWDFDGDGRDEILVWTRGGGNRVELFSAGMQSLHVFNDWCLPSGRACADMDGDGDEELLLVSRDRRRYALFDQLAQSILTGEIADNSGDTYENYATALLVDLDGDGRHELLHGDAQLLQLTDAGGRTTDYDTGMDPQAGSLCLILAVDVDGDGKTELFEDDGRFWNPALCELRLLELPEDVYFSSVISLPQIAAFDIDGNGSLEICLLESSVDSSDFCCFARDGRLVYHEVFPGEALGMTVLDDNGTQRLYVGCGNDIRVLP